VHRDPVETYRALIGAPLTYHEVGATRAEVLPAGYGHVQRDVSVGTGSEVFERAAMALSSWRMHEEAGLPVIHSGGSAAPGVVVVLRAGWAFSRPASLLARAGGPISRMTQAYVTDRYVSAIRRLGQG
jgi:uncharacterized protein (UPF0548 family)